MIKNNRAVKQKKMNKNKPGSFFRFQEVTHCNQQKPVLPQQKGLPDKILFEDGLVYCCLQTQQSNYFKTKLQFFYQYIF